MDWFVDFVVFCFTNMHIIAIIITVIAFIFLLIILSIEFKAKYYLAVKNRMIELESKKSKK